MCSSLLQFAAICIISSKELYFFISFDLMPVISFFFVIFFINITFWQDQLYSFETAFKMSCQALTVGLD